MREETKPRIELIRVEPAPEYKTRVEREQETGTDEDQVWAWHVSGALGPFPRKR